MEATSSLRCRQLPAARGLFLTFICPGTWVSELPVEGRARMLSDHHCGDSHRGPGSQKDGGMCGGIGATSGFDL